MGIDLKNPTASGESCYSRFIKPAYWSIAVNNSTPTVARVYLFQIELICSTTVEGIYITNEATVAGEITAGIYSTITNDTPAGGTLEATSASTVVAGTNQLQYIPFTSAVTLAKGQYYLAIEASDATTKLMCTALSYMQFPSPLLTFDIGGGYGALPTPCPAISASNIINFSVILRGYT